MSKIFVSYCWDNKEHQEKVLSFANHLRKNGFDAYLDIMLSQQETAINFIKMMHKGMSEYEKVIIILSEGYKKKAESFEGGVGEEYTLLINDIKDNTNKYILVSFKGRPENIVPFGLKGRDIIDLSTEGEEERLFRKLLNKPLYIFEEVGKAPEYNSKQIQEYQSSDIRTQEIPVSIISIESKQGNSQLFSQLYKWTEVELFINFKNISMKTIESFSYEIRIPKQLDSEFYKKQIDGECVLYSETFTDKIFSGQTKRSKPFQIKVTSGNFKTVLASEISVDLYTDDGSSTYKRSLKEIIKIKPGNKNYADPEELNDELFLDPNSGF